MDGVGGVFYTLAKGYRQNRKKKLKSEVKSEVECAISQQSETKVKPRCWEVDAEMRNWRNNLFNISADLNQLMIVVYVKNLEAS